MVEKTFIIILNSWQEVKAGTAKPKPEAHLTSKCFSSKPATVTAAFCCIEGQRHYAAAWPIYWPVLAHSRCIDQLSTNDKKWTHSDPNICFETVTLFVIKQMFMLWVVFRTLISANISLSDCFKLLNISVDASLKSSCDGRTIHSTPVPRKKEHDFLHWLWTLAQ